MSKKFFERAKIKFDEEIDRMVREFLSKTGEMVGAADCDRKIDEMSDEQFKNFVFKVMEAYKMDKLRRRRRRELQAAVYA